MKLTTMGNVPAAFIGEFIDAAVQDRERAAGMLSAHPDLIDARWIHGETPLHFLAVEGFTDAVRFLAERGANVNAVNEFGDAPLIDLAVLGLTDAAELLLSHGANPNASSATHDNVLACAVRSGNARLVARLLEAGANGRYLTDLGESVFDALPASEGERLSILAILAQHGIVPDPG
jgi:ankyrin repeat protein